MTGRAGNVAHEGRSRRAVGGPLLGPHRKACGSHVKSSWTNNMPVIGYAINPGLFTALPPAVETETHSELTKGQTVADWNAAGPNARICLEVDAEALTATLTEPPGRAFQ